MQTHGVFSSPRTVMRMALAMALIFMMGAVAPVIAQPTPQPRQEYHVIDKRPDRLFLQLSNGLLVIVQEVRTSPVVSAQVWVKTGSIYEQEHVGAGLSHFLEHLLAGGSTARRTEEQSNELLGAIGARTNAATGLDNVHYYINTTAPHAATAVELLSDWMVNNLITPEEYERERQVIQREFEHGEGSPQRLFWKLTQQARYQVHPARHPVIGYIDEFRAITRDEIHAFYRRMYVPNNMVFVVAGDVVKEDIARQIIDLWQGVPAGKLPELSLPHETPLDGPRALSGEAAIDQPRLRLAWPGTRVGHEHDYALDLLANVLGGGESSPLQRVVRDEQRAVNAISAYNLSFPWGEGFFGIDSTLTLPPLADENDPARVQARLDGALDRAKEAILDQVRHVAAHGVTPQELARARRQQLAGWVYHTQSAQAIASQLARNLIGMGDPDYQDAYLVALEAITPQDVQAAARAVLREDRLITISLLPRQTQEAPAPLARPADPDIEVDHEPVDLDNRLLTQRYEQIHTDTARRTGATRGVEVQPVRLHQLPNGLRVVIQRTTLAPAVAIQLYQLGGLLADQPGQEGVANATATMLTRGTQSRSAQAIATLLEDLGASLSPAAGNNTFYIQGQALSQDWPVVLELLADVLLHPSFPQEEWDRMQPRLLAAIDRQKDDWGNELRSRFREAYYGDGHPWSQSTLGRREVVAQLTPADLTAYHQAHLGAGQTVLAIIGDVDPAEALAQVTRLFASLPSRADEPFTAVEADAPTPGVHVYPTAKPMVGVQFGFGPGPARSDADYAATRVLVKVLSNFPVGWLEQELRGRGPGLVYAVGAGQSTGVIPGYVAALFNTQPATAVEAVQRTAGVFRRVTRLPVDQATLDRAKAAVLTEEFLYKQSNSDRAGDAALNVLYGLGLDEPQRLRHRLEGLTADQLLTVARRYLREPVVAIITSQPLDEDALKQALTAPPEASPETSGDTSGDTSEGASGGASGGP